MYNIILTNHTFIIENIGILYPFCSDHCTVTAEITFKEKVYKTKFWKYQQADQEAITNKMNSTDWSFINNCNDIDEANETFSNILKSTANQYIHCINFTKCPTDKPWVNNDIWKNIRQRNRLFHKAKSKKSSVHRINYKNKCIEVITLIQKSKLNYFQKLKITLSDPKTPANK